MIVLSGGYLGEFILFIVQVIFGPPLLLALIGGLIFKRNPKSGKVFFILASIYLIVGLGICGALMTLSI